MSLAMYIVLSVLHRYTLDAMPVATGVNDLKAGLSHMIVIICTLINYFALFTILDG